MLLIHTALHAEAHALIRHFGLKREHNEHAFACFTSGDVWLVESGIGKVNAATAVAWLSGRLSANNPVWLNIGMVGHGEREVGSLVLAQRVEDAATASRWYPANLIDNSPDGENLLTIDQEIPGYPEDSAIDMEASGFMMAASRFTTLELVQSLKVISDNCKHPARRFKASEVEAWVSPHLETIAGVADRLCALREIIIDHTETERQAFLQRWHFSQYQQTQLQRLIQRYRAIYPGQYLLTQIPTELDQSRAVIGWIEERIRQAPVHY